jgi:hypothetical protein
MKWKSKYLIPEPEPGSTRLKRVFAWRPTDIDGTVVWLVHFEVLQGFIIFEYAVTIDGKPKKAKSGQWVELSKRIM